MKRWYINILLVGMCLCMWRSPANAAKTIRIGLGHQSFCTDTYTSGIVVKGRKLLEKYLPKDGKDADVQYGIVWEDDTSGPPITHQMLAGKLDIGIMGDYPLLVNGARFQETKSLRSLLVAMTGYCGITSIWRGSSNALGHKFWALKIWRGGCRPRAARELIHALKQEVGISIHFDTHDTSSIAAASVFAAIDAGVDAVYSALDAMSGLTAQPNLSAIAAALAGTDLAPGLDPDALQALW